MVSNLSLFQASPFLLGKKRLRYMSLWSFFLSFFLWSHYTIVFAPVIIISVIDLYFTELFPRLENKTWINQTKIRRPHPIQHTRMDGETKISPHKTARHRLAGYDKSLALSEKLSSTQRRYGSSSKKSSRKQRCYKGQARISGNKARSRCTSILLSRTAGSPLRR